MVSRSFSRTVLGFDWSCLTSPFSLEPKDLSRSLRKSLGHLEVIRFVFVCLSATNIILMFPEEQGGSLTVRAVLLTPSGLVFFP